MTGTRPPYHRTIHTWSCPKGHTITIDDQGWPQAPGMKEAIVRAFKKERCGDPACGGVLTYSHSDEPVIVPDEPRGVPLAIAGADPKRFGRAFDAMPCTPGGAVEARRNAGKPKQ